jgi:hypothetical protein
MAATKVAPTMPAAPAGVAVPSSKPGEVAPQAKKEKKAKVERQFHPFFAPDAEGKPTKRVADVGADLPGYDPKVHKPLKRNSFLKEEMYYDWQIKRHEDAIAELKTERETAKTTGGKEVNKLKKMLSRIAELRETLKDVPGVNVDELIGKMTAKKAA